MTNLFFSRKTLILAAFAVLGGLNFAAPQAQAGITDSLQRCNTNIKGRWIKCCETVIKREGKPLWMLEAQGSCQTSVVCTRGSSGVTRSLVVAMRPTRCVLLIPNENSQGTIPTPNRQRQVKD